MEMPTQDRFSDADAAPLRRGDELLRRLAGPLAVLGATVALGACQVASGQTHAAGGRGALGSTSAARAAATAPSAVPKVVPGSALAVLATLKVQGRGPKTGYSRAQFGPAWQDVDHNGCDTRNDILNRDLTHRTWRTGTHDCVVLSGQLNEPYTGRLVFFSKAQATAVQIDHVVAISDAWQKGAANWPAAERLAFANDPLELLAVDGPTNEAKGDGDAATWLPPEQVVSLCLRGPPGHGQSEVPVDDHFGRTRRDRPRPGHLPGPAGPHRCKHAPALPIRGSP